MFDVYSPKQKNLLIMKNLKRIFLLITLVVIASKVLLSDFEFSKPESKSTIVIASK